MCRGVRLLSMAQRSCPRRFDKDSLELPQPPRKCQQFRLLHWMHPALLESRPSRPRGPMDKASAYGAGDCRFESCRGHCRTHGS